MFCRTSPERGSCGDESARSGSTDLRPELVAPMTAVGGSPPGISDLTGARLTAGRSRISRRKIR
jgi:hypothetical protein